MTIIKYSNRSVFDKFSSLLKYVLHVNSKSTDLHNSPFLCSFSRFPVVYLYKRYNLVG